ncbi:DMT family transporter [Endozoicomonas ascidiicola]|uniref:DMT family transporter n=1 Tax=Endozoicomonas ascidiicola TaxID=1698521 RepID=UPI0008301616|nr:EamA family transporter [Endozoicomonas ascidiicola]
MLRNYLFLFGIGVIWGSQFIFQQMAVADLSPVWVGAGRSLVGFMTLAVICQVLRIKSNGGQWFKFSLIGLLEATIPFVLVAWGQQYLDTAIAAILMGTIPFFTVILAPLVIRGAKITFAGMGSVLLGFAGLLTLFYPELMSGSGSANLLAAGAIVFAAACFAVALLLLKGVHSEHPLVIARNVLGCASAQIVLFALIVSPVNEVTPTTSSLMAITYLGMLCAGLVYFLYMVLIRDAGPVFASMNNYLVPMIGVLLGATINGEALTAYTWVALGVILMAVAFNQFFSRKEAQAA